MITSVSIAYSQIVPMLDRFNDDSVTSTIEFAFRSIDCAIGEMTVSSEGAASRVDVDATDGRLNVSRGLTVLLVVNSSTVSTNQTVRLGELGFITLGRYEEQTPTYLIGSHVHPTTTDVPTADSEILLYNKATTSDSDQESYSLTTLYERELYNRKHIGMSYRISTFLSTYNPNPGVVASEVYLDFMIIEINTTRLVTGRARDFPTSGSGLVLNIQRQETSIDQVDIAMNGSLTIRPTVSGQPVRGLAFTTADDVAFANSMGYTLHVRFITIGIKVDLLSSS